MLANRSHFRRENFYLLIFFIIIFSVWIPLIFSPLIYSQETDPFYLNRFEEGERTFLRGNYREAIKELEIAVFGLDEEKEMKAKAFIYMSLSSYYLGDKENSEKYLQSAVKAIGQEGFIQLELKIDKSRRSDLEKLLNTYQLGISIEQEKPIIPPVEAARVEEKKPKTQVIKPPEKEKPPVSPPVKPPVKEVIKDPIKELETSIKTDPRNPAHYYDLYELYEKKNNLKEARDVLKDLLEKNPQEVKAYYLLGKIDYSQKKYKEAVKDFNKVLNPPEKVQVNSELLLKSSIFVSLCLYHLEEKEALLAFINYLSASTTKGQLQEMLTEENLKKEWAEIEKAKPVAPPVKPPVKEVIKDPIQQLERSIKAEPRNPANYYELYELYMDSNNLQSAEKTLENLVKKNPAELRGYYLLGRVNYQGRNYKEARKNFERLLELSKRAQIEGDVLADTKAYLILVSYSLGDRNELKKILTESRDIFSEEKLSSLSLEMKEKDQLQSIMKSYEAEVEAAVKKANIESLSNSIKRDPKNIPLYYELYESYRNIHDLKNAKKTLESLVKENPNEVRAHYLLIRLNYDEKDYKKLRNNCEDILKLSGKVDIEEQILAEAKAYMILCSYMHEEREKGRSVLAESLNIFTESKIDSLSMREQDKERFKEIIKGYEADVEARIERSKIKNMEERIKNQPKNISLYYPLYESYRKINNLKGAKEILESLIKANPNEVRGYYLLGALNHQTRNFNEARKNFEQLLKLSQKIQVGEDVLADTKAYLILCSYSLGKREEAKKMLADSRGLFSEEKISALSLGAKEKEEFQRIIKSYAADIEAAIEKVKIESLKNRMKSQPKNTSLYYELYESYRKINDLKGAKGILESLIKANPNEVRGYYLLGALNYQTRSFKEARKIFGQLLMLSKKIQIEENVLAGAEAYQILSSYSLGDKKDVKKRLAGSRRLFSEEKINALNLEAQEKERLQKVIKTYEAEIEAAIAKARIESLESRIKKQPKNTALYFELYESYKNINDLTEARKTLEGLLKNNAGEIKALYFLGKMAYSQKKYREASRNFNKVMNPPANIQVDRELKLKSNVFFSLCLYYLKQKENLDSSLNNLYQAASEEQIKQVVKEEKLEKEWGEIEKLTPPEALKPSEEKIEKGPIRELEEKINTDPRNISLYYELYKLHMDDNNLIAAKQTLQKLLKQNPVDVSAYLLLAKIYYQEKDYKEAEKNLERVLKLSENVQIEENILLEAKAYFVICSYLSGDKENVQRILSESTDLISEEKAKKLDLDAKEKELLQKITEPYRKVTKTVQRRFLTEIVIQKAQDSLEIEFYFTPYTSHQVFQLKNPNRIVIDLMNLININASRLTMINDFGIKAVRAGMYKKNIVRVVVDVEKEFPSYRVQKTAEGLKIIIKRES